MAALPLLLEFASKYPTRKFGKGELILVEGEVPTCAYIVKSGIIKGYAITAEGVEKPIAFDSVAETFPIGWVLGKLRWSPFYYDAFLASEVYCVPRQDYLDFLRANPEIMFEVFDFFC